MTPLRIVQFFPGKIWGGAEQLILDFSRELTVAGHQVTLVARDTEPLRRVLDAERMAPTVYVPSGSLFTGKTARVLATTLGDADVLHIHDVEWVPVAVKAKKIAGSDTRIVLTRHIARASRTLPWRRGAFGHLHRMVFVSDLARKLWLGANTWMPVDKVTTVTNSIPPFAPDATKSLREHYGIPASTPLLVYSGRVRRSKGCETIVRALSRISDRDWAMVFLGAPKPADYHRRLASIAAQGGIADRVHFHGFTADARHAIQDADIGLAPSIVREACPLSPIEFMQQGIPVITTDNGPQPDYITDGVTGMLVHPDDDAALAKKIAALIDDKSLRQSIGDKARQYFENYLDYHAFINKMMTVYAG